MDLPLLYSEECMDTLCECLSRHKNDLMVIVAGYEDELEKHFFNSNKGLRSRFIWKFTIEPYSAFSNLCLTMQQQSIAGMNREKYYPKVIHRIAECVPCKP